MPRSAAAGLEQDLEQELEAEDGVVDLLRTVDHLTFPWVALPAGPRRWAPTDLSIEVDGPLVTLARLTYRTVGDRAVVVAGAHPTVDVDAVCQRLATPLLFAYHQRRGGGASAAATLAAMRAQPTWDETTVTGWRTGEVGVGDRPVRLVQRSSREGHLVVAAHGVAIEELTALVATLVPLAARSEAAEDLHARHRRALAQRWWDAPRAPWRIED